MYYDKYSVGAVVHQIRVIAQLEQLVGPADELFNVIGCFVADRLSWNEHADAYCIDMSSLELGSRDVQDEWEEYSHWLRDKYPGLRRFIDLRIDELVARSLDGSLLNDL